MLRALLVGILAVSAMVSCKGGSDAPAAVPGAPAGSIVDLAGQVTARRGEVSRPLELGSVISADDVIETGPASHVAVLLTHNNVRWEIGQNKREPIGTSAAWQLARQDKPSTPIDEQTSAAGRPGEKTAATTASTASNTQGALPENSPASPPAETMVPRAEDVIADRKTNQGAHGAEPHKSADSPKPSPAKTAVRSVVGPDADVAPRSPPPPSDGGSRDKGDSAAASGGGKTGSTAASVGALAPMPPSPVLAEIHDHVTHDRKQLEACVASHVAISISVTKGVATITTTDQSMTDAARSCLAKIATGWKFVAVDAHVAVAAFVLH